MRVPFCMQSAPSVAALFVALSALCSADRPGAAAPQKYLSRDGRWQFSVTPADKRGLAANVVLIEVSGDAARWSTRLDYVPANAVVSNSGAVITFDTHHKRGREHSLVVRALDGSTLGDYTLREFAGDAIGGCVIETTLSSVWTPRARIELLADDKLDAYEVLFIQFQNPCDTACLIDVRTGAVLAPAPANMIEMTDEGRRDAIVRAFANTYSTKVRPLKAYHYVRTELGWIHVLAGVHGIVYLQRDARAAAIEMSGIEALAMPRGVVESPQNAQVFSAWPKSDHHLEIVGWLQGRDAEAVVTAVEVVLRSSEADSINESPQTQPASAP